MSGESPNVITPRELAVVKIRRIAREAEDEADHVVYGTPAWVFLQRFAELVDGAADDVDAVVDTPE